MDIMESIKLSLEGLKSNKMRSFLTMLGIIIGIASVIGIMTIGDAMTNFVNKEFQSVSNQMVIYINPKGNSSDYAGMQESDLLSNTIIETIENRFGSRIEALEISGPTFSGEVKDGKKTAPIRIYSVSEGGEIINNVKMQSGRFLNQDDIVQGRSIAVISSEVVKEIFGGDNSKAIGSEINVYTDSKGLQVFSIAGVYKYETNPMMGMMGGSDKPTTNIYIPLSTGERIEVPEKEGYDSIMLSAKDTKDVAKLSEDLQNFLISNYYAENDNYEPVVYTAESELDTVNQVMGTMNIAIGAIAAISLLVGGIGVMNILLVSVTERTREIGVRKALGATNNNIRSQFIVESIILCIIGGAMGVVLGGILGYVGSSLLKAPTLPSINAVLVAVGFSTFIGVFFGYYPANKAAKLNPIDALRYE
ncbi:ABC transporter permease [Anaerosphaera multitolerans]|uniref:FtsX-like permease family protein n=1 Tax=Anaerosphaera multitolerans TaxID=2487351 RepID=A0A437S6H9_9FIRM|nr:ABC transporter permease [Anaerosphaera multitolerans]RVU54612.1 FtsX-like permease family protein [Anaerosphaera multitolerans]